MTRLLVRVPLVLLFAVVFAAGAYWLGFSVFGDNFDVALTAAAVASVVLAVAGLGSLTRVVGMILLGLPITVAALATTVYVAGMHHVDGKPRLSVVVATARCTASSISTDDGIHRVCERYEFALTDTAGKPFGDALNPSDTTRGHSVGERLDVYQQKPGMIKIYPKDFADPLPQVRTAARVAVPVFIGYVVLAAIVGVIAGLRRREAAADPAPPYL